MRCYLGGQTIDGAATNGTEPRPHELRLDRRRFPSDPSALFLEQGHRRAKGRRQGEPRPGAAAAHARPAGNRYYRYV